MVFTEGVLLGVKERQGREREAVTTAILDAARELFVAEGYHSVSIRKIAEKIEYSPAAIYSYFPSKDDIFFALAEEGFRMLLECVVAPAGPDPLEDIRRAFLSLYEFSKAHPEHYALMFVDRSVPRISRDWERFGFVHEMRQHVAATIQRAVHAGVFPAGTNAEAALLVLVAAVHGAAALRLCERLAQAESGDALAHDTFEAALAGLRAGITQTFRADPCH
jgi:AcrR family transcriptional regulator